MGVRFGSGGFQSQVAAEYAGKQAPVRFFEELLTRRNGSDSPLRLSIDAARRRQILGVDFCHS